MASTPVKSKRFFFRYRNFAIQLTAFRKTPKASFQIYRNQSRCECNLLVKCLPFSVEDIIINFEYFIPLRRLALLVDEP